MAIGQLQTRTIHQGDMPNRTSRSDPTREGTQHIVKHPDQAGTGVPTRGPTHLRPSRGSNPNPAATYSYVDGVRGVAPRRGLPTMAIGPPCNFCFNAHPRAPTYTAQHPPPRVAPTHPRPLPTLPATPSNTHHAMLPPSSAPRRNHPSPPNNLHHPPHTTPMRVTRGKWDTTHAPWT